MKRVTIRRVYEIGGSLGITLPTRFVREHMLSPGTRVLVTVEDERCIIETLNKDTLERLRDIGLEMLLKDSGKGPRLHSAERKQRVINSKLNKGVIII